VIVPWQTYLAYGDTNVLADQYESMTRWLAYTAGKARPGRCAQARPEPAPCEEFLWDSGSIGASGSNPRRPMRHLSTPRTSFRSPPLTGTTGPLCSRRSQVCWEREDQAIRLRALKRTAMLLEVPRRACSSGRGYPARTVLESCFRITRASGEVFAHRCRPRLRATRAKRGDPVLLVALRSSLAAPGGEVEPFRTLV
jgi:hypothetical protein